MSNRFLQICKWPHYLDKALTLLYVKTFYQWFFVPIKVRNIRKKEQIKVLFVLYDLSLWKTEPLFLYMQNHHRFTSVIGITAHKELRGGEEQVRKYCIEKKYPAIELSEDKTLLEQVDADILVFQKPYEGNFAPKHWINKNRGALCVMSTYFLHDVLEDWQTSDYLYNTCWQQYFENSSVASEFAQRQPNNGKNILVTGTPFMDALMLPKETFHNPWKRAGNKKRIIYAPHHSLPGNSSTGVQYSTFLDYADIMLELMAKYKREIYFIFKPHPRLYHNLLQVWGQEMTDAYYAKWRNAENGELLEGLYIPCFKHSDALIHDCGSFTIEYHYTQNPVLYLENSSQHTTNMCSYAKTAYDLHYKAHSVQDIEQFIINVINGVDSMQYERNNYFQRYLIPPHGKTACENIINAILGEAEYRNN